MSDEATANAAAFLVQVFSKSPWWAGVNMAKMQRFDTTYSQVYEDLRRMWDFYWAASNEERPAIKNAILAVTPHFIPDPKPKKKASN